jgi:carbon-monoxide dehydrogenase small subunit
MLITARDIVARLGEISDERIREELAGNLCRCTGYVGIVNAVHAVVAGKIPRPTAPVAAVHVAAPVMAAATTVSSRPITTAAASTQDGRSTLTERIVVDAAPDAVWEALADPRRVAACVPGAEITEVDGEQLVGTVRVAMGPIKAAFACRGTLTRNDAS